MRKIFQNVASRPMSQQWIRLLSLLIFTASMLFLSTQYVYGESTEQILHTFQQNDWPWAGVCLTRRAIFMASVPTAPILVKPASFSFGPMEMVVGRTPYSAAFVAAPIPTVPIQGSLLILPVISTEPHLLEALMEKK